MNSGKAILLTGAHRSGSKWAGRILSNAPGTYQVYEPFSVTDPPNPGICNTRFKYWFTHVDTDNEREYYPALKNMMEFKYDWLVALTQIRTFSGAKRLLREYSEFRKMLFQNSRVVFKDPIAFFSAEWLARKFDMEVVIMIRHPAAFISSLKKLCWSHPFSHFLEQPTLMKGPLAPFEKDIRDFADEERPILDQGILLWRIFYHTALEYKKRHANWHFVRHEDLSKNPVREFRNLFQKLDLDFTSAVENYIISLSSSANPVDPDDPIGSDQTLKRDSHENITNWKRRLTSEEVERIHDGVSDISKEFYSENDW